MTETHAFMGMSSTGRVTPELSIHLPKTKSRLVPPEYELGILHRKCATRFVRNATPSIGCSLLQSASTSGRLREAEPWRRLVGVSNPGTRENIDRQIIVRVSAAIASDPPSCIFVGPIETAEKARLEALYEQARDSYYSGRPLIVDDMFDKVETRLRWHGSKLVLKYPRCSLKRFSAYADAEVDPSQLRSLAIIWSMVLTFGVAFSVGIPACTVNKACHDAVHSHLKSHGGTHTSINGVLVVVLAFVIGVPVVSTAVTQLQGLWRGDVIALKGCCPNCGEEVYTFVRADDSEKPRHRTECHVCERSLVFQANIERFNTRPGQPWAYGRVYLVSEYNKDENS